ncbi:MAG: YiiX/YebB-like N1pC/P60 family cysteine hydrolase [Kiritimatiellae bacterium]|nr:YiiX/YebB-like N1pC/P60 family cysteine hydrolase [Kiritimatiellia bacterium]
MLKNKRLLWITLALLIAAFTVLCSKVGYPHHRVWAFLMFALSLIPVALSYYFNRRILRLGRKIVKKKTRPVLPYIVVAVILVIAVYVAQILAPVKESPLLRMAPGELRAEVQADITQYTVLRGAIDNLVNRFQQNALLKRDVAALTAEERKLLRLLWREGFVLFIECDMLKEKYSGFYQVDYATQPALHADAFFLAYATYLTQYRACLTLQRMVNSNKFMETLLNEAAAGMPEKTYSVMKQLLVHPDITLRVNAGTIYYELVKSELTFDPEVIHDFENRRRDFFSTLARNPHIYIENPLDMLEEAAFKAWFPLQKHVALQMSNIRTTSRDHLITPEMIAASRSKLQPGDILLQRRNWYMTNIGIPGFWPHAALYIGTLEEMRSFFGDIALIKARYPEIYEELQSPDSQGYPMAVIEAIKPGVILQSLEKSAHCDYLAVIRPNLTPEQKLQVLLNAFAHYQKPYDLNFDFATDNQLVCSELVYKAYNPVDPKLFSPEIVNGRLLLPPNLMAEQIAGALKQGDARFSFVMFLDAIEKQERIVEGTVEDFMQSWSRPKWDIMQR